MRMPFGQNFLTDTNIAAEITALGQVQPDDLVLEIGPGKGILTRNLLPLARRVVAVELDTKLYERLTSVFKNRQTIELVNMDFMNFDLPSEKYKVVANLPYNVATRIIEKLLTDNNLISAVVMVQKEVAQRICARPKTADYGYFSVFTQYYAESEMMLKVAPDSFFPKPKVDSMVICMRRKTDIPVPDPAFFGIVKKSFAQKRKTIVNSLTAGLKVPKQDVLKIVVDMGFSPTVRAEEFTISEFLSLTSNLRKYIMNLDVLLRA